MGLVTVELSPGERMVMPGAGRAIELCGRARLRVRIRAARSQMRWFRDIAKLYMLCRYVKG
jgi:hypothetical protein